MNRSSLSTQHTLFHFNRVPVVARPSFWLLPIAVWGVLSWLAGWRRPERTWPQRVLVGALAVPLAFSTEIGHALAHTVSARCAGAPMDRIVLSSGMPRTLYTDNAVSPTAHRLRALGGAALQFARLRARPRVAAAFRTGFPQSRPRGSHLRQSRSFADHVAGPGAYRRRRRLAQMDVGGARRIPLCSRSDGPQG